MDLEASKKDSNYISRKELYLIRKEKLLKEIQSAKRLMEKDVEPLRIADEFIHGMFKLMEDGITRRNPNLSKKEIDKKIREILTFTEKIKKNRIRGKDHWQK